MRWRLIAACTLTSMIVLIAVNGHVETLADTKVRKPIWIRADEIGGDVQVLGRLGLAMHRVTSVSGVWVERDEDSSKPPSKPGRDRWFRVMEVDGKRLGEPIDFRSLDVTVYENGAKLGNSTLGEDWQLRAYETWPDYDHPAGFWQELGQQVATPAARGPTRMIGVLKKRIVK